MNDCLISNHNVYDALMQSLRIDITISSSQLQIEIAFIRDAIEVKEG